MKKIIQLIALMLAALFVLTACTPAGTSDDTTADTTVADDTTTGGEGGADDPADETPKGSALNVDPDAIDYMMNTKKYWVDGQMSVENLEENVIDFFNNKYVGCGISDLLYNIASSAPFASDDPDLFDKIDKYYTTNDNGYAVDYTKEEGLIPYYLVYETTDVDPYQIWFDLCRENGINPWLSFRMNDVHSAPSPTGHSPFGYEARENGWLIGNDRYPYWVSNKCTKSSSANYAYCYNYAIERVREVFLKEIDDRLSTYDVYGIELDWLKQIWCFPEDDVENCKYINMFMEEVNKIVEKYEAIWGHDIKIAIKIARDIDENMYFGFDARYLAEMGWVDVIITGSSWGSTDSDIPVEEWVEELKDYNVDVWVSLECHVLHNSYWQTIPTLSGFTAQYLGQGADKIYLFNLFNIDKATISVCESLDRALSAQKRSYVVTESNRTPYGVKGIETWWPLPLYLAVNTTNSDIVINHSTLNYTKETIIYVGVTGVELEDINEDMLVVKYNGVECKYEGISTKSYMKEKTDFGTIVAYRVPANEVNGSLSGEITFDAGMNLIISYIELMNGNSRLNT